MQMQIGVIKMYEFEAYIRKMPLQRVTNLYFFMKNNDEYKSNASTQLVKAIYQDKLKAKW